jgi:transcriptional regulator GlxA family with amidase domain
MGQDCEIGFLLERFLARHPAPTQGTSLHVRGVLTCVHDQLFDPRLTVEEVRTRCRITDHNISCRFKHEVGVSIKRYIERLRLQAAAELLPQASFTIAGVALSVGFRNLQTFYAAFARIYGCRPGTFRRASHVLEPASLQTA